MAVDIGIDLGTASVLVYVRGKGVILKEPSVLAYDRDSRKIKAIGEEAVLLLKKAAGNLVEIRPLKHGVISDYALAEEMMKYFVQKATGKLVFRKPAICVCIPTGITEVEKKTVIEATYAAGAREVFLMEGPVADALGAGVDITKPMGSLVVDIGAGTTDVAVISLGSTVVKESLKIGGNDMDEAISRYIRQKHRALIGYQTAEMIKIQMGSAYPETGKDVMEVQGRDLNTGLPVMIRLTTGETEAAFREITQQIIEAIFRVLEQTPPELAADILENGIILAGGGCLLNGLEELVEEKTGIRTVTADQPMLVACMGTGQYTDMTNVWKESEWKQ